MHRAVSEWVSDKAFTETSTNLASMQNFGIIEFTMAELKGTANMTQPIQTIFLFYFWIEVSSQNFKMKCILLLI